MKMKRKIASGGWEFWVPYIGLVVVCILFGILSEGKLFSARNLKMLVNQVMPLLIICCGAAFYWAHGAIDLSVAGVLGVACITSALGFNTGSIFLAFLFPVLTAIIFGLANGVISAILRLPSFLTSLCVMFIASGLLSYIATSNIIKVTTDTSMVDNTVVKVIAMVIVVIVTYILFEYTTIGKSNKLIGGNPQAAHFSGINVNRNKIIAFVVAAACIGIAAFFTTARAKSIGASTGNGMQFNVITAMVFGGMSFGGGKNARISNGVLGALTFTVLTNGMQLSGVGTDFVQLLKAVVFIIVVYMGCRNSVKGKSSILL